jgi:hypothetical protein
MSDQLDFVIVIWDHDVLYTVRFIAILMLRGESKTITAPSAAEVNEPAYKAPCSRLSVLCMGPDRLE